MLSRIVRAPLRLLCRLFRLSLKRSRTPFSQALVVPAPSRSAKIVCRLVDYGLQFRREFSPKTDRYVFWYPGLTLLSMNPPPLDTTIPQMPPHTFECEENGLHLILAAYQNRLFNSNTGNRQLASPALSRFFRWPDFRGREPPFTSHFSIEPSCADPLIRLRLTSHT